MKYCIGIDEAGRGPLAGPVTAAAVLLPDDFPTELLNDSKKLSPSKRTELETLIKEHSAVWCIGWASHRTIDEINIHRASLLAMKRSFEGLSFEGKYRIPVLIDGKHLPVMQDVFMEAVPGGDALIPEIMAASILAKTERDRWMMRAAKKFPHWGFDRNKGYPTKDHRNSCRIFGFSPIHRRSFRITGPFVSSCNQEPSAAPAQRNLNLRQKQ